MATKTYKLSKEQIDTLYSRVLPRSEKETKPQYTYWQLKADGVTYTAYTSGKVVVQGKDLFESEIYFKDVEIPVAISKNTYPQAGSDEVGCGDYLGPIVVGICLIPNESTAKLLLDAGLRDSKAMTENKIFELDRLIRKYATVTTIVLDPEHYNNWRTKGMNMVDIKCVLHKMAWERLQRKKALPGFRVIDGFCTAERYDKAIKGRTTVKGIQFIPKADSTYVSCMAGAVVARAKFLTEMEKMSNRLNTSLERGADEKANMSAVKCIRQNPELSLSDIAKLDFANTAKVRKLLTIY